MDYKGTIATGLVMIGVGDCAASVAIKPAIERVEKQEREVDPLIQMFFSLVQPYLNSENSCRFYRRRHASEETYAHLHHEKDDLYLSIDRGRGRCQEGFGDRNGDGKLTEEDTLYLSSRCSDLYDGVYEGFISWGKGMTSLVKNVVPAHVKIANQRYKKALEAEVKFLTARRQQRVQRR